jgi:hypothetical protein
MELSNPESDLDRHVDGLEAILNQKLELINSLKGRLSTFRKFLKEEEMLSQILNEQRNEAMDIFDLSSQEHGNSNDNIPLLEGLIE